MEKGIKNSKKGSKMKTLLPNRTQTMFAEIKDSIAEKLGTRIERMKVAVAHNYYVLGMEKKNLKSINIVRDFTSEQIFSIVKNFENACYTLTLANGVKQNVDENELLSVYKKNTVAQKVKAEVKPTDGLRFAIATVRKSRKGNDRFLHKSGKFGCSYANRYVYNTVKGAEALIARIYAEKGMKPNTLKVIAA